MFSVPFWEDTTFIQSYFTCYFSELHFSYIRRMFYAIIYNLSNVSSQDPRCGTGVAVSRGISVLMITVCVARAAVTAERATV